MKKYRRVEGSTIRREGSGDVVVDTQGDAHFRCPCDFRQVYVKDPPHGIEFDEGGLLTLNGSCGYNKNEAAGRPANWCHFSIDNGVPVMYSDAQCPGNYDKGA